MEEAKPLEQQPFWVRAKLKAELAKKDTIEDDYIDVLRRRITHYEALGKMHAEQAKEHQEAKKVCDNKASRIKDQLVDLMSQAELKKITGKDSRATLVKRMKLGFWRDPGVEDLEVLGDYVTIKRQWAVKEVPEEVAITHPEMVTSTIVWNDKEIAKGLAAEEPDERLMAIAHYNPSYNVQFYMETGK